MSVKSIMSTPVVSVEPDDPLSVVRDLFASTQFHHLLVVEDHKLVGIISDRDFLKVISPRLGTPAETAADAGVLKRKAHQIMTRKPVVTHPEASIYDAVDIFQSHRISCIPVVDSEQVPVGIISWRDVFKAIRRGGQ